jgi:hypothetical protein
MVSLTKIDPANFKLVSPEDKSTEFTYYTFDWKFPGGVDFWNIIGLRLHKKTSLLFELRFLSIEEEMLEWTEFEPLRDAYNFVSLNPEELGALIQFFETWVDDQLLKPQSALMRFRLLTTEDLTHLHLSPSWVAHLEGHCYRYFLGEGVQHAEAITVLVLPHWSFQYGANQSTTLELVTFRQQQLEDPTFKPFDTFGVSTVTFDQRALDEFITLLKQRTYENFVRASQT